MALFGTLKRSVLRRGAARLVAKIHADAEAQSPNPSSLLVWADCIAAQQGRGVDPGRGPRAQAYPRWMRNGRDAPSHRWDSSSTRVPTNVICRTQLFARQIPRRARHADAYFTVGPPEKKCQAAAERREGVTAAGTVFSIENGRDRGADTRRGAGATRHCRQPRARGRTIVRVRMSKFLRRRAREWP